MTEWGRESAQALDARRAYFRQVRAIKRVHGYRQQENLIQHLYDDPKQFWKIVIAKTQNGPKAFGFVLKQKLTGVPLEFAVPEDWEPYQIAISDIEDMLFGLATLDWCKAHDVLL